MPPKHAMGQVHACTGTAAVPRFQANGGPSLSLSPPPSHSGQLARTDLVRLWSSRMLLAPV